MGLLIYINLLARIIVSIFELILLVYCVSSWVIRDPYNKFMQTLGAIVEPVVAPVRNILYRFSFFRNCPLDFSTFIVLLLCNMLLVLL